MAPLLTIHKPELVGDRWATTIGFSVRGQPIELTVHASKDLGNRVKDYVGSRVGKYVAFGAVAPCCSTCGDEGGSSQFEEDPSHLADALEVVGHVSNHPDVKSAFAPTQVDRMVQRYFETQELLHNPATQQEAMTLLSSAYEWAKMGDEASKSLIDGLMAVGNAVSMHNGAMNGEPNSVAFIGQIENAAMQGDGGAIQAYALLDAVAARMHGPVSVVYDVDRQLGPKDAAREIGNAIAFSGIGARRQSMWRMVKSYVHRMLQKLHPSAPHTRAPRRPLLA